MDESINNQDWMEPLGPCVLLPEQLWESWNAPNSSSVSYPHSDPIWDEFRATYRDELSDYWDTCKTSDYVEVLTKADGAYAVFGDEPLRTTTMTTAGGFAVVRHVHASDPAVVARTLREFPWSELTEIAATLELPLSGRYLLVDAGCKGGRLTDEGILLDLPPSIYSITCERLRRPQQLELLVHRVIRISH